MLTFKLLKVTTITSRSLPVGYIPVITPAAHRDTPRSREKSLPLCQIIRASAFWCCVVLNYAKLHYRVLSYWHYILYSTMCECYTFLHHIALRWNYIVWKYDRTGKRNIDYNDVRILTIFIVKLYDVYIYIYIMILYYIVYKLLIIVMFSKVMFSKLLCYCRYKLL